MNSFSYLSSIYLDSERKTVKDLYIGDFILIYIEETEFWREAEVTGYKELSSGISVECIFTDECGTRIKKIFYALSTDSFTVQLEDYYIYYVIDIRTLFELNFVIDSRVLMKIISKMTTSDLQYYLPQKYLV